MASAAPRQSCSTLRRCPPGIGRETRSLPSRRRLSQLGKPVITKDDILRLEAVEQAEAERQGLEEFKFASNEEMLNAMGLGLAQSA